MVRMPGRSALASARSLSPPQLVLRDALRADVTTLAGTIGERNVVVHEAFDAAAKHIEQSLLAAGYKPARQTFVVEGISCANIEAELRGSKHPGEIVVLGAHYDSVDDSPGADDNATGVAALLAIAKQLAREQPDKTIRFVAFANEEPPYFQTEAMGSWQYAKRCHDRGEKVVAMLSLESLGYYTDAPNSQDYPPPLNTLYPSTGNFLGFASNLSSGPLLRRCVETFRKHSPLPSEGAAVPPLIAEAGWSDQWAFWQFGYKAVMVTDTAPFRNPHYHRSTDRPDTIDYDRFALAVDGLMEVTRELAR